MTAIYNEIASYPAAWLRNLIAAGHIADGVVDERSIVELKATELVGHGQRHFFAGLGGWSRALRLAGWPDDRPVWTASCPCQPFSDAGRGLGTADERHLWPVVFGLVRECRPRVIFGEQVASGAGLEWLAAVRADLEGEGYAFWAVDLCAAGVGAPHIRQRLYFVGVANSGGERLDGLGLRLFGRGPLESGAQAARGREVDGMADGESGGRSESRLSKRGAEDGAGPANGGRMGNADSEHTGRDGGRSPRAEAASSGERVSDGPVGDEPRAPGRGFWSDIEWIACRDGKSRPTGAGVQPLAYGVSESLDRMRAEEYSAAQEVAAYAQASKTDPREVLRMVREDVHAWTDRQGSISGVRGELHAPSLLLPFLLRLEPAFISAADGRGFAETSRKARKAKVRSLRIDERQGRPSPGRESDEQRSVEPADSLPALSRVLARHAEAHARAEGAADAASSRVGKLRAAGNAIVPQVAAAFIRSVMPWIDAQEAS